jgi:hypothetical protein
MVKIFLITGYDSFSHKTINRVFRVPSEALEFSLDLTDAKMEVLTGEDYLTVFNNYLINN